jgi:mono/diheme cytochrome c family protein
MARKSEPQKPSTAAALREKLPMLVVLCLTLGGAAIITGKLGLWSSSEGMVEVSVPALSPMAQAGGAAFAKNCAACHGENAAGGPGGPPLVHPIYNPGHHGDMAFVMAAERGVRQHHWSFGHMPPQPQVTRNEIAAIVRYVRELQAANGIATRPHSMQ